MHAFATSERFATLDAKDRDRLEALCKLDAFSPGTEILSSDTPGDWLYLIAAGDVEVRAKTPSGEVVLGDLRPGDLFGELEGFAHLPDGVRHVAREDTIVRAIPKNPLKQELRQHRSLATGLLSVYARSISEKVRSASDVAARFPAPQSSRPPQAHQPGAQNGPLGRPPHLTLEETVWLAVLGQSLEVQPGEAVVSEGETSRSFYVVERGLLDVKKKTPAGEVTLAQLADGDLFGFMAFVDGKPRSASVVAQSVCQLTRVEPDALQKATQLNFTVGFKFLATLCGVLGRTYRDTAVKVMGN